MKKELQNEEITRIIERENVITFKRKNEAKGSLKSQKDEEEDAESSKSNHTQQPNLNKISRKNVPLPELNKERKRLVPRNLVPDSKPATANYLEREVRQQDNIMLKNVNNLLTSQNIKLKTKNSNLEKEIARLQKIVEEDPLKNKIGNNKDSKSSRNDSLSLKIALKNMQRELEDVRKENGKIKASIKFTTITQLEIERDNILQETVRLREMLEDERTKLIFLRANQQGMSAMEQRLVQLQERNNYLQRQNNELKGKATKLDEKDRSSSKMSQNEKNLNKMLFNARRTIKQKERELEVVKSELKKSSVKVESLKVLQVSSGLQHSREKEVKSDFNKADRNDKLKNVKDKRLMSKSAQKYRASNPNSQEKLDQCENCRRLRDQNIVLTKQNQKLKADIDQLKMQKTPIGELSKKPIIVPSKEELDKLQRFLIQRFKAHHLNIEEAAYHLINFSGKAQDINVEITVGELLQIMMAQPFSILSDRYVQTFVTVLCYSQHLTSPPANNSFAISEDLKLKRSFVRQTFVGFIGNYELMNQNKEEEMFIQIAELITQYQQHILKALTDKRNTESTIAQKDFYQFFKEIDLQKDYIDFMVSQIILESLDLDHLNIYNLFQIFYMPPQEQIVQPAKQYSLPGHAKKKYNMIESVVKEEDQEYEESKSFMESRQKTVSKHDDHEQQYEQEASDLKEQEREKKDGRSLIEKAENDEYQQHFEEQKMQNPAEEEKANEQVVKEPSPQHYHIENVEEEYIEDYEG